MKYLCGMCFISEVSQLDLLECAFVDVFQSNDIIIRSFMKMSVVMWYECCFEIFGRETVWHRYFKENNIIAKYSNM